jgi:site-specific recombinase XerD
MPSDRTGTRKYFTQWLDQYKGLIFKIVQAYGYTPIARHTLAKTVALKNGIPLETIQIMMGHTQRLLLLKFMPM